VSSHGSVGMRIIPIFIVPICTIYCTHYRSSEVLLPPVWGVPMVDGPNKSLGGFQTNRTRSAGASEASRCRGRDAAAAAWNLYMGCALLRLFLLGSLPSFGFWWCIGVVLQQRKSESVPWCYSCCIESFFATRYQMTLSLIFLIQILYFPSLIQWIRFWLDCYFY